MIDALTTDDVPAAAALMARVGLQGATVNVARYLRWQPDSAWALRDAGALVGIVTILRYGAVGFVGCMGVEPARQGRGDGRRLLEHAHAAARASGVETLLLEATAAGEPLYAKLGYVVEHETLLVARAAPLAPVALGSLADARAELLALDRAAFGAPRDAMITGLVAEVRGALVRDARGLAAYGLLVGDRLGPIIARDPAAGRALVEQLAPAAAVAAVPVPNAPALAALEAAGFAPARTLRRMRLGPPIAARVDQIFALASPGAG